MDVREGSERTNTSLTMYKHSVPFRKLLADEMDTRPYMDEDILLFHIIDGDLTADERLPSIHSCR